MTCEICKCEFEPVRKKVGPKPRRYCSGRCNAKSYRIRKILKTLSNDGSPNA